LDYSTCVNVIIGTWIMTSLKTFNIKKAFKNYHHCPSSRNPS
jgi:hypothetical protein